jgi:predicted lipoprotein with Yx(FWY)xxD motif
VGHEKRKLMVVGAAMAAALALPGCAPAGYNQADYGGAPAAEPAANAVDATPTPTGTATPGAEAKDDALAGKEAPKLDADQITSELQASTVKRMGEVVKDQDGYVLYRFDGDKVKPEIKSSCNGDCARIWQPALTEDGEPQLEGVDAEDVGTVTRADGTKQITIGKWPVYRYYGDKKPGAWTGQNVGGKWFVVKPDGTKNLTCLPAISKPVAPPPAADDGIDEDDPGADSGDAGSDYSY